MGHLDKSPNKRLQASKPACYNAVENVPVFSYNSSVSRNVPVATMQLKVCQQISTEIVLIFHHIIFHAERSKRKGTDIFYKNLHD